MFTMNLWLFTCNSVKLIQHFSLTFSFWCSLIIIDLMFKRWWHWNIIIFSERCVNKGRVCTVHYVNNISNINLIHTLLFFFVCSTKWMWYFQVKRKKAQSCYTHWTVNCVGKYYFADQTKPKSWEFSHPITET